MIFLTLVLYRKEYFRLLPLMPTRKLISFDWALKRLLRSKANFAVLEGFLSELLKQDITILELLESESNKSGAYNKSNQVDLKVKNQHDEILIIEVQYERELDYMQRILYSTSKVITEHLQQGDAYHQVVKVISVNILYFDLGQGKDYVYHECKTHFTGIHQHDQLRLSDTQQEWFGKVYPHELFPEYYLLKVNQFDDIARDRLDEWLYFLKHEEIKQEFTAKGLQQAKDILDIMKLSEDERAAYEQHQSNLHYQASMFHSSYTSGHLEGRKEGREEGRKEGREEGREEGRQENAMTVAKQMKREW